MQQDSKKDQTLSAAECAKLTGLTIRALRLYETARLITPQRTAKGWRCYAAKELARLNEILALKQLGLSISRITQVLADQTSNLDQTLALQQDVLTDQHGRISHSLALISAARAKIASGQTLSTADLINLVKETNMTNSEHDIRTLRRYEQARPRKEVVLQNIAFTDYDGFYQHVGGVIEEIRGRDGGISSRITGQTWLDQFPENVDHFFFKVVPAQTTFQRGPDGEIVSLTEHQDGFESTAKKITPEAAATYESALAQRIKLKTPIPNSAKILRSLVLEQQQGTPDYNRLAEPLGLLVREQQGMVQPDLMARGEIKDITFRGVADDGADVYEISFSNDSILEWRFASGLDGRIHMMWFRPIP